MGIGGIGHWELIRENWGWERALGIWVLFFRGICWKFGWRIAMMKISKSISAKD